MTKVTTTQRIVNTKVSKTLATLLVSSGFVMTLPVAMVPTTAFGLGTTNVVMCGNGVPLVGAIDCTTNASGTVGSLSALTITATNLTAGTFRATNMTATGGK